MRELMHGCEGVLRSFRTGHGLGSGLRGGCVAGADDEGTLGRGEFERFLSGRAARRERFGRQAREDMGHRDRSRGERIGAKPSRTEGFGVWGSRMLRLGSELRGGLFGRSAHSPGTVAESTLLLSLRAGSASSAGRKTSS